MTWLLDTNIVAYVLNDAGPVRARLNESSRVGRVLTSIIVVAELASSVPPGETPIGAASNTNSYQSRSRRSRWERSHTLAG